MILDDMKEWDDSEWLNHGMHTHFNAGARVGYNPDSLMVKAKRKIKKDSYPNLWIYAGGGGIETCSGIPGMINEMMLQSHEGIIRIFPVFPSDQKASFYRLRTFGAFLFSSAIENGKVKYAVVESEKGRDCNILNPWPGKTVILSRNGKESKVPSDSILKFKTELGGKFILAPEGTDFNEIRATGSKI